MANRTTIVGVDEAGYGPNLGPLVIAASAWSVPESLIDANLYDLLKTSVSGQRCPNSARIHIADSKEVHQSHKGIAALERSALALWCATSNQQTVDDLSTVVDVADSAREAAPWSQTRNSLLPVEVQVDEIKRISTGLREDLFQQDIQLVSLNWTLIPAREFNRRLERCSSKGELLSAATMQLIRRITASHETPIRIVADRHGGRKRYADLLTETFSGEFIRTVRETAERSEYQWANTRLRLQPKAESHLPVAAASIIAKYLRELAMLRFNAFWQTHLPDLKPTKGYPVDAKRFRDDIADKQRELGIEDDALWRRK